MNRLPRVITTIVFLGGLCLPPLSHTRRTEAAEAEPAARISIDDGHLWLPPFGLQRVGRPPDAVVEIRSPSEPTTEYCLVVYEQGKEIGRSVLTLSGKTPETCRVALDPRATEVVLTAKPAGGAAVELARQSVARPAFQADAIVQIEHPVHPVDLGAILVPSDWLLLADGQTGTVAVAAVCRAGDVPGARVTAWFESAPAAKTEVEAVLARDRRADVRLPLPPVPASAERDVLHVSITNTRGEELWRNAIRAMLVHDPPKWPAFGATETRLRYDAPISVRADDGAYSSMDYAGAWDPRLSDVVVSLPNGTRFVFWRGSSYVPFWAGRCNTGLSYEWAETSPPADGYTDCVEPLMDKELRYGRVRIVESTSARVHVRWSYQSCDFKYKVWGDSAVEDYYFYPDGFGTRVLTLQSEPSGDYELCEFIILTPQATYPFDVLPPNLVDVLFLDGQKRELTFPFLPAEQGAKAQSRDVPAIYRVRLHKDEPLAAVCFNPRERKLPPTIFPPFSDQGRIVTPTYWGSHWPLARGKTTGWAIDDRVRFTPCHNSVMSWARCRPEPLRAARLETLDTLGRSKPMIVQTWAWLIGMSDADDARLLQWAASFAKPPALELDGARLEAGSYVPERRAIRLIVESDAVTIGIKPDAACVNPVFELSGAPQRLVDIRLDGRPLGPSEYAWDGKTLWINATPTQATSLRLRFDRGS